MLPRILVFGTDSCKFCKLQQQYLDKNFSKEEWKYIDISHNEGLEIAVKMGIDNLPTLVLLNSRNEMVLKKEGMVSCDEIMKSFFKDSDVLPLNKEEIDSIKNNKGQVVLSYNPNFKKGQRIKAISYARNIISNIEIEECQETQFSQLNCDKRIIDALINKGGQRKRVWKVQFKKQE